MAKTIFVHRDDANRQEIEQFIKDVYRVRYSAEIDAFPDLLAACMHSSGRVECAAGLRMAGDGFFSEVYLDAPIEQVLGGLFGSAISRGAIFEVSTLASRSPVMLISFIHAIVDFGKSCGFRFSFFTLTRFMARLVEGLKLAPLALGDADFRRVPDYERWGRYYAHAPRVFAVMNDRPDGAFGGCRMQARHATAV